MSKQTYQQWEEAENIRAWKRERRHELGPDMEKSLRELLLIAEAHAGPTNWDRIARARAILSELDNIPACFTKEARNG